MLFGRDDPNAEYFKVRTTDGKHCVLRYGIEEDAWTLQSAFDGAALLERPGIEVISVDAKAIREAEAKVASCERCRPDKAGHPFDWILADVLDKHGPSSL